MSFLQPLMLVALAGAAVPIIIHLIFKRRPRRQPFAAMELLLRSVLKTQRRWRLRRFLLLAMRVTLLAALALAAARPILGAMTNAGSRGSGPQRLALVIDGSLSMRARPAEGRSGFERAIERGRELIEAMGPEDQAVILLATQKTRRVISRPTADRQALQARLQALAPSYGHAQLSTAVTAAAQALAIPADTEAPTGPKPRAQVVVLSDIAGHGIRSAADLSVGGTQAELVLIDVFEDVTAAGRSNRAITQLDLTGLPSGAPRTIQARARVRSFDGDPTGDDEPRPVDITLRGESGDLYAGSLDIVPGTISDKSLTHAFDAPGFVPVSVHLERDLLEEDDVRYGVADVRREVRALIVDGVPSGVPKEDEVFYLERAVATGAADQPPPRTITADDLATADLSGYDVVILAGVGSLGREDGARLTQFVENGGGLLVSVRESLDVDSYNTALGRVLPRPFRGLKSADSDAAGSAGPVGIESLDSEHPVMRVFAAEGQSGLKSTKTRAYMLLQPGTDRAVEVLASWDGGAPALIETQVGRGRCVVLTTSIDRDLSDLPIRPAFVPLVRQLILHLGQALARIRIGEGVVGQPYTMTLPKGATGAEITTPGGEVIRLDRAEKQQVVFSATAEPGHHRVALLRGGGRQRAPALDFAVNIDPQESDLRPLTIAEATSVLLGQGGDPEAKPQVSMAALARKSIASPERIAAGLLLLMLAAFVVESLLTAQRKAPGRATGRRGAGPSA